MPRVTNARVLKAAIKSRVGGVIVVGWDSHKKPYVASSGRGTVGDLEANLFQLAQATGIIRRARAALLRQEKRAAKLAAK